MNESSLETDIIENLAMELQKEIDEGILCQCLIESGWTEVKMHYISREQAVDIIDWCIDTLTKNQWKRLTGSFIFRNKKEAEWFILRWL